MNNKVVLITGASRGIGAKIAEVFASNGYNVIVNYNNSKEQAEQLVSNLNKKYNSNSITFKADISNEQQVQEMIETIINKYNRIDVLINNAGIARDKDFSDRTIEDFKQTFEVNVYGTFIVSKYVSKYMLIAQKGKIINISSTNGIDTLYPTSIDYDASKSAVISLTKNMATQFAPYINVNAIAPGWVDTDMNKELPKDFLEEEKSKILLNRFAELNEIAELALFLASDKANYINSEVIRIDGGM